MKHKSEYFFVTFLLIFPIVIYIFCSRLCFLPLGLVTGELNINAHLGLQSYPLVIADIINSDEGLKNVYAVPVSYDISSAKIKKIGPFHRIFTPGIQPEYSFKISGKRFPVMCNARRGAIGYYYSNLFAFLRGNRVFWFHFSNILLGAVIIVLAGYLCSLFLGRRIAGTCVLLLSTSPVYIVMRMIPIFQDHFAEICVMLILVCLFMFNKKNSNTYIYLVSFLIGFGISQKVTIIWMLGPLFITGVVLHSRFIKKMILKPRFSLQIKYFSISLVCFLAGISPMLICNLDVGSTANLAAVIFLSLTDFAKTFSRLVTFFNICTMMFGDPLKFFAHLAGNELSRVNYFPGLLLLFSFLFPFWNNVKQKPWFEKRKAIFPPVMVIGMFFFIAILNISGYGIAHPMYMVSYIVVMESIFLVTIADIVERFLVTYFKVNLKRSLFLILAVAVSVFQAVQLFLYSVGLDDIDNPVHIAAAHQKLAKYLLEKNMLSPIATNFNLMGIIEFLTKEKVRPIHYWRMWQNTADKEENLKRILLKNVGGYYVLKVGFKDDICNTFPEPELATLLHVSQENNVVPVLIKNFYLKNGKLMFSIYKLNQL